MGKLFPGLGPCTDLLLKNSGSRVGFQAESCFPPAAEKPGADLTQPPGDRVSTQPRELG